MHGGHGTDTEVGRLRTALVHRPGAELSRITGYSVGFIRPIVLGLTVAPRPQGRRARSRSYSARKLASVMAG